MRPIAKLWSVAALVCFSLGLSAGETRPSAELARLQSLQESGKLNEARSGYESLLRAGTLDDAVKAASLLGLARIDVADGHYTESIRNGGASASLFRKLRDDANVAAAMTTSGIARLYSGDYAGALRDQEIALEIARRIKDQANEVTRLNNIGNVFYFQGRYSAALDRYSEAMQIVSRADAQPWVTARRQLTNANLATIYQRLGLYDRALDTYGQMRLISGETLRPIEQAQVLANMGALYRRLGDPVKALEQYHAAQALYQRSHLRSGEIAVLNNIGIAQVLDLNALPQALETFDKSVALATESQDRPLLLHSTIYRGETLAHMGEWERARTDFRTALQLAESLHSGEEEWKALFGLARFETHTGNHTESQRLLRQAVAQIESLRSEIGSAVSARGFLTDKRLVYDELIRQLIETASPNTTELFTLFEQSRSRGVRQEASARTAVRSLTEVQQALRPEQTLLEYWLGKDGLGAWISITSSQNELRRLNTSPELKTDIARLAASLARPADDSWMPLAASIRQQLLPAQVESHRHWIIVADRELSLLPFEALLGAGVEVSYLPAAGFLINSQRTRRAVRPPWFSSLLAFADPRPASAGSTVAVAGDLTPLPRADDEVNSAGKSLGGRAEIHIGADALKKWIRPAPVVHLATHGQAVLEDPARSWLLFAPAPATRQRFDFLFLPEVEKMNLGGVQLLTASACETDAGAIQEGEGPRNFSRAFLGAGVRTVVSSLWRVEDASTSELMKVFYAELGNGQRAAAALRSARSSVAALPGRSHPCYWAAFTLSGDPDLILDYVVSWPLLLAGLLGAGGLGLVVIGALRKQR